MQRADWQRTCGRAAIFSRGRGRGGEGELLCLVSIIKTRQHREQEEGEGSRGKGRQAATWPSALGVIYALLMQIFAEAGEWEQGQKGGRQLGLQSIDGWLHRSSDASESHRSIGKVAKRSDPNRT